MDDLFSLIRKMSKTEKRLFVIFSKSSSQNTEPSERSDDSPVSQSKPPKKYLQLFQAYQKLAERHDSLPPDAEQKIRRSLGNSDSQFPVLKNYLSEMLLDFLRHHHRQNLPELRLNNLLLDARILEEKGEMEWALRKLKKALAEALDYELFHIALEAIKRIIRISVRNLTVSYDSIDDLLGKMDEIIGLQKLELDYRRKELHLAMISKERFKAARTTEQKAELDDFEAGLQRRNLDSPPITFQSQHSYYVALNSLHRLRGENKETYQSSRSIIEVWDRYPHLRELETISYMIQLGNLLVSCIRSRRLDEAGEVITKMEAIPCKNQEEVLARISNLETRVFIYLINCNRLEEAIKYGSDLEKRLEKYHGLLPAHHKKNLLFNFAVLHFLTDDYRTAHDRMNDMLQKERKNLQKFSIVTVEMLVLLLRYEMKDYEFVRTSYHTISKRMRTLNFENVFERKAVHTLFKLVNTPDERSRRLLLRSFRHYLDDVRNSKSFTQPTGFDEIEIWADARSEGISMRDAFARTLQRPAEV